MDGHHTIRRSDGTKNGTIREIREAINDQFNNEVRTFMVNKYAVSQMKLKPKAWRAIRISNRWTKPTETLASMPLPQMEPQKTRPSLGVNASVFIFWNGKHYLPHNG